MRAIRILLATGVLLAAGVAAATDATNRALTIFAAASAADCATAIGRQFEAATGVPVKVNAAGSSVLARQIEQGAACDVFVSADQEWMDYLDKRKLIQTATRRDLLGNRLVVVTPAKQTLAIRLARDFDFAKAFSGRLAVGDPAHVPAGKYAREALQKLGWWEALQDRLAPAENVRAALMLVERGETEAGIVYATDARAAKGVVVATVFPEETHAPIRYPAALCAGAGPGAADLLQFLYSPAAVAVWTNAGFVVIGPESSSAK